jgi:acid phosphatase class B
MVLKNVRAKVEKGWTTTKKLLAMASVWGLIYSLVTIARLGVAFDYDDTLVDSAAAYEKASRSVSAEQRRSAGFWAAVNNNYDLESPKLVPYTLACLFRVLGFKIMILADRSAAEGDALRKEWRHLAPRGFVFTGQPENKHLHLQDGRYVLFFADSDRDMLEAKKAHVYAVRVKRGKRHVGDDDYNPGTMGELVLPLSEL